MSVDDTLTNRLSEDVTNASDIDANEIAADELCSLLDGACHPENPVLLERNAGFFRLITLYPSVTAVARQRRLSPDW